MQRRQFLHQLLLSPMVAKNTLKGAALGGNALLSCLLVNNLAAAEVSPKKLIVIFQRGGCDGLNTVVPYGEDDYYQYRPSIAIPPPSANADSALDLNGFFGLHPALAPLHNLYHRGALAVMPAVHYDNASRSHFVGQDILERASDSLQNNGWLNRYLINEPGDHFFQAISFGDSLSFSLNGDKKILAINDLDNLFATKNDNLGYLRAIYSDNTTASNINKVALYQQGDLLFQNLDLLSSLSKESYAPENGAEYPDTLYGKQLMQSAKLLKKNIGLEILTVDANQWDTHSGQGGSEGTQAELHREFASGIEALYTDLGSKMNDEVLILTMTEFGRTVRENASGGTDHGNASCWFAIGNQVQGGIHGHWPGLNSDSLYQGRYLAHSIDYRDIYAEILTKHLKTTDVNRILDGHIISNIDFL